MYTISLRKALDICIISDPVVLFQPVEIIDAQQFIWSFIWYLIDSALI